MSDRTWRQQLFTPMCHLPCHFCQKIIAGFFFLIFGSCFSLCVYSNEVIVSSCIFVKHFIYLCYNDSFDLCWKQIAWRILFFLPWKGIPSTASSAVTVGRRTRKNMSEPRCNGKFMPNILSGTQLQWSSCSVWCDMRSGYVDKIKVGEKKRSLRWS